MAPGSCRPPAQELLTFKDVSVDFTQEEWGLLDHPQKELYKEVMLENAKNLLSLGLAVSTEDLISYFEEEEAPWLLEHEGLRSCYPEGEIRPEMKETTAKLSISVKETHEESFMRNGPCDFTRRQICAAFHRIHRGEKPYHCLHGWKVLSQQSSLIYQQKINPGVKLHECHECGKTFSKHSAFIIHGRYHIGRKPYECNQCGKAFTQSSSIINHERVHAGKKSCECNQCGKAFRCKSELSLHQRKHTGEKPYECNQCGKAFTLSSSLINHQRVHVGKKPCECNQCGKAFRCKSDLGLHQRIHTAYKYKYHQCGKAFKCRTNLSVHQSCMVMSFISDFYQFISELPYCTV